MNKLYEIRMFLFLCGIVAVTLMIIFPGIRENNSITCIVAPLIMGTIYFIRWILGK